jgi:hypothetical protein
MRFWKPCGDYAADPLGRSALIRSRHTHLAVTKLRYNSVTQAYVDRLLAAGKTQRDALRILKRRLARLIWLTMMRDLAPAS